MKRLVCFFLSLILVVTCCIQSVSAYSVPQKEEFIQIKDVRNCETFYEFREYMKENYSIEVDSLLSTYNFNSVKAAAAGIEYVINKYPQLNGKIKQFKYEYAEKNYAMAVSYNGTVYFYNYVFVKSDENIEKWLMKTKKDGEGYQPQNCENIFSYGVHEASHMLTTLILEDESKDFTSYKENIKKAIEIIDENIPNSQLKKQKMREVSQYATTNESECIAEAMCDYLVNGDEAAELSIKIAEYFNKLN